MSEGQTALFGEGAPVRLTSAVLDHSRVYRYALTRRWNPGSPDVNWIMLNPSTADEREDDPTIRRCEAFARSWGYGGIVVTNLFALRATDPKELYRHADPVGPQNDVVIRFQANDAALVIVAWGNHGSHRGRANDVAALLSGVRLGCLGTNKGGQPVHPLYQPKGADIIEWRPPSLEQQSTQP